MEMLESTISSLESTSSGSVSLVGELKDKKLRSVADNGAMRRPEAQISLRSLPPLFQHPFFTSLVDRALYLTCEGELYAFASKVECAHYVDAYNYRWVLNASNSGLFVPVSLPY